jgi:hypothetical protein
LTPGVRMLISLAVSLTVIGVVVLIGVLGHLIEKNEESAEHKPGGNGV